ncbi:MAG: S8 family peptidase [Candidatus Poribacteria bacterium]|nr:S8 family peptidase [Candidatus Poribacteria bacterium]MDE0504258.1 S8 family peptidase [Candidatus Poribacteria bacterium]
MRLTQYSSFPVKTSSLLLLCSVASLCVHAPVYPSDGLSIEHTKVSNRLHDAAVHEKQKVWILFEDKGILLENALQTALEAHKSQMSPRTKDRRLRRAHRPFPDLTDLPVQPSYTDAVLELGGRLRAMSRWLNAISLEATPPVIAKIARLPFVRAIDPIDVYRRTSQRLDSSSYSSSHEAPPRRAPLNYGDSLTQIEQIQANFMHEAGFSGYGMIIGLLDTGFNLDHTALRKIDVLGQRDFVNDDNNPADEIGQDDAGEDDHGSIVLSILAANTPGTLIGVAYRASYLLAKTENVFENGQEFEHVIEEDWWIEGLEWAEEMGAEIIGSSLGYAKWYRFEDLDGKTSKLTIAANLAVEKGMSVIVAAGNLGDQPLGDFGLGGRITVPADGFDVLAIGAVDRHGRSIRISSRGPTFDGRIKPDLSALGLGVTGIDPGTRNRYTHTHSGTSASASLGAGVVALLSQAFPLATPRDIANALRSTASQSHAPDNAVGYGIIRCRAAYETLLEQFGETGTPETSKVKIRSTSLSTTLGGLKRGVLLQNYPNPFNAETWIPFRLMQPSRVTLCVYDLRGGLIHSIAMGELPIGDYSAKSGAAYWNGHNENNNPVSSGVYFCVMEASGETQTRKLIVVE